MKQILLIFCISTLAISCVQKTSQNNGSEKAHFEYFAYNGSEEFYNQNPLEEGKMYNPLLSGFYPDPSICRKGEDYYLVTSTFSYFPGVPLFHSKDLVNWEQIGHVLDRPSQFNNVDKDVSRGIYAPAISYNPFNNKFYMITTFVGGIGNFYVTAEDPSGPWSDPILVNQLAGIDPSLFFDADGKAYILHNDEPPGEPLYKGHKAIWIQELDWKNDKLIGTHTCLRDGGHEIKDQPIWIEGPHLYKIGEYYYLMAAEGGTSIQHSEVIFRSKKIMGPYERNPDNPIITQRWLDANREYPVTNTGHADLVQTPNGDWYSFFLGCRPYNNKNYFNLGRETFMLPVTWKEGWPTILPKGEAVTLMRDLPKTSIQVAENKNFMPRGNFSYTDSFEGNKLAYKWVFLRTPDTTWYNIETISGVTINPLAVNLREKKCPSALFTRQRHNMLEVETALNYVPTKEGEFAGLTLFQNEAYYFAFGVTIADGKTVLELYQTQESDQEGTNDVVSVPSLPQKNSIAKIPLGNAYKGRILLRANVNYDKVSFEYQLNNDEWQSMANDLDATILSTQTAGGFVGTMIGLYASTNDF